MLYRILQFPASIAIYFYCRILRINKKEILNWSGPLLIASNHPNSFLDAIVLASLFKRPIYSLARGDVFINKFVSKLLGSLNILPVYRLSEGAENLSHNFKTFSLCNEIFKKKGIVLIFSEGRCINEWHLRSLKKGTARIALNAWAKNIPLEVLPIGINYSTFRAFGKNLHLNIGNIIQKDEIDLINNEAKRIGHFNKILNDQLSNLVYEIDIADKVSRVKKFEEPVPFIKKLFLYIPSMIGKLIHAPLYYIISLPVKRESNDHYDSIIIGLFFILYPIYILLLSVITCMVLKNRYGWLMALIMPFTSWSYLQLKKQ